jgi:hypothetical protein
VISFWCIFVHWTYFVYLHFLQYFKNGHVLTHFNAFYPHRHNFETFYLLRYKASSDFCCIQRILECFKLFGFSSSYFGTFCSISYHLRSTDYFDLFLWTSSAPFLLDWKVFHINVVCAFLCIFTEIGQFWGN